MAIDRYYRARNSGDKSSSVATPQIIIELMLMDEHHWTPQQIYDIPKTKLEIIMLALNQKSESESGLGKQTELLKESNAGISRDKIIGSGIKRKRQL